MLYNLKEIREQSGKSRRQAAEELGVPFNTYRNWEQCVNMPRDNQILKRIAHYFHVSIEALFGYDLVEPGSLDKDNEAAVQMVPLFKELTLGGTYNESRADAHIPIPTEVMSKHPKAFLLEIRDERMNNVLPLGCYALVDPKVEGSIKRGAAYAVFVGNEDAKVYRVTKLEEGFDLAPDSKDPTAKSKIYDTGIQGTERIEIIGEVVWYVLPADWII